MEGVEGSDLFEDTTHHHPHHRHGRASTMPNIADEDDDEDAFWSRFDSPTRAQTRQERRRGNAREGWQNRAASALRNLRPGSSGGIGHRRSQSVSGLGADGAQPQQPVLGSPGSRTFLIYVIGGYYPPDHSIVTGGPDNLESFEALLELVELLGNAKAPTASREDIERSGLEIIKKSQLGEYERQNKISSNCTERCLICLDDYEEEDEIRVMNCRHAFHRGCVDKWLQTGKNNCPACRSRGVSTEGASPTQTVS